MFGTVLDDGTIDVFSLSRRFFCAIERLEDLLRVSHVLQYEIKEKSEKLKCIY